MKQNVPIAEIMTVDLITLNPKQTLYEAEDLFRKHKIRHIPVVDGKKLLGVLSYSDLLKISYADVNDDEDSVSSIVYDMYSISQIMAKTLVTVSPNETIKEVTQTLAKHSFHSLPVVEKEELKGIITTTDLLNYFLEQY